MAHIQIRISEEEKEYAQQLFLSMGLTMSGAIKLFIRKSIQSDSLPFDISANIVAPKKNKLKKEKKIEKKADNQKFANFVNREI